jgi:hypothetical protein
MPLARYFLFVGAALLALVFAADVYLPKSPSTEVPNARVDLSTVRIRSDHKWPERVEIDTTLPTITHPAAPMRVVNIPPAKASEETAKAQVRDALAEAHPADSNRPKRKHRTIARGYYGSPPIRLAQQPQFGFYGNGFFGGRAW